MFPRPRRKSKLQAFIDLNQCALSRACFETADHEATLHRRSCDGRGGAALAYLFRAATSSLGRRCTCLVTGFLSCYRFFRCDGRGGAALAYDDHDWLNTVAVHVQPVQVTDAPAPWNLFRAATSSLGRGCTCLVTGFWGSIVICRVRSAPLGLTSVGVLALAPSTFHDKVRV